MANDPLYKIRTILRSGAENLTKRQQARLAEAIAADQRHLEVYVARQCAQRVRDVYHAADPATGRKLAEKILAGFPTCPIPEIARLGRTLKQWADAFLSYFRTGGASNGGAEAVNGLIELHPPHSPRLQKPRELPTTHAPRRRRPRPAPTPRDEEPIS